MSFNIVKRIFQLNQLFRLISQLAVRRTPSSRSILAWKFKRDLAFSTLGILIAISAESGDSKTIFDLLLRTRQTSWASPRIVITALALPILKVFPIAS